MHRGGVYVALGSILAILSVSIFSPFLHAQAKTRVEVSIFYPDSSANTSSLKSFESSLGVKFASAKWYGDWTGGFDPAVANRFISAGYIPEFTWGPSHGDTGVSYDSVVAGDYDSYIIQTAQKVASVNATVRISLAPEMNTDWTPWGIGKQGNNRDNHKLFWRHVVQKFRDAGANNVQWIWSPNVRPWNASQLYGSYADMFPGSDYVDYMGLDGYNWGSSQSWSSWQTFSEVFGPSYNELVNVSSKSILIMEMASTEAGGSKAAWIADMFTQLKNGYSRIAGFTWFHINKETDWRINSSAEAAASFVAGYNGTTSTSSSPGSTPPSSQASPTTTKSNTATKPAAPAAETPTVTTTPTETPLEEISLLTLPDKRAGTLGDPALVLGVSRELAQNVAAGTAILAGAVILFFLFHNRIGQLHLLNQKPGLVMLFAGFGHVDTIHHPRKYRHLHALHKARQRHKDNA